SWSWAGVTPNPVRTTTGTLDGQTFVEWSLSQSDIGASYDHTSLVFQLQQGQVSDTGGPYLHDYTPRDPASPFLGYFAENDAQRIYYHAEVNVPSSWKHLFIDTDGNPGTGYPFAGIGAEYMIENGSLYWHARPGWGWDPVGSAHMTVN